MCFYFSHLTCTFHFNCCLNKIFVIVIVIVISYGWLVYDSDIIFAVTGIITVTSCSINNKLSFLMV